MPVKIEARILIFPGTDFHFPSTSVPPDTFLGSEQDSIVTTFGCNLSTKLSSQHTCGDLRLTDKAADLQGGPESGSTDS